MSRPIRIQLQRTKGWRLPPNTVVVSRPTRWGNPYTVGNSCTAAEAVEKFKDLLETGGVAFLNDDNIRLELRGKNLACWCKPGEPCHADVLLEIANP